MIAFKGFDQNLKSRLGGKPVQFEIGKTYIEEYSKTFKTGFHCCENPFQCLSYYTLGRDRFCQVDAAGSLDEDNEERIACTEITIVKELTVGEFFAAGMLYMVNHPMREKWEVNSAGVEVKRNDATASAENYIAIARGIDPIVRAVKGAYVGLIYEPVPGAIEYARAVKAKVSGIYALDIEGRIYIDEEKED